jgi:excisionase family DNA binding protein
VILVDELLTLEELAEKLRVNVRTVTKLVKSGEIRSVQVGRQYRIPRVALDEFLRTPRDRRGEASA